MTGFGPFTIWLGTWSRDMDSTGTVSSPVWLAQDRCYRGLGRAALGTELHAEHSVCWTSGSFCEHKATLLPRPFMARLPGPGTGMRASPLSGVSDGCGGRLGILGM